MIGIKKTNGNKQVSEFLSLASGWLEASSCGWQLSTSYDLVVLVDELTFVLICRVKHAPCRLYARSSHVTERERERERERDVTCMPRCEYKLKIYDS